jgi:hypothetical protein
MLDFRSAPKTKILYMTIQWTFLPSLVQICFEQKSAKLARNVHWLVLYQICVFGADLKFNMAARVHNVFSLAEILKIFLSETTKYEHFCQVWFKFVLWFQKKRWKCEIPIGSNVKLSRVMVAILNFRSANDSLDGPVLNLWIVCRSEIQDDHHDST